jgi:hypothetical protein
VAHLGHPHPAGVGDGLQPLALHDGGLRGRPVVEDDEHRSALDGQHVGERVREQVHRRHGLQDGQEVAGVSGQRGSPARPPESLGDPPRRPRGQDRPAPHEWDRVGEGERELLGRVGRRVPVRGAPEGDRVEVRGDVLGGHVGTDAVAVDQPQRDDGTGQRVAGHRRQQRHVAAGGHGARRLAGRGEDDELAAAPTRLGHRGDLVLRPAGRGEDDDEVQRAGPSGQARGGPGDERHRAPRFEDGTQQPGVRAGDDQGAGPGELALPAPPRQLVDRRRRRRRLPPDACPGLGEVAQPGIRGVQRSVVVEEGLVEQVRDGQVAQLGHQLAPDVSAPPGRVGRASSTSITGMPSRTG